MNTRPGKQIAIRLKEKDRTALKVFAASNNTTIQQLLEGYVMSLLQKAGSK